MNDQPAPPEFEPESVIPPIVREFFRELVVLLVGIAIGAFWHIYYSVDMTSAVHVIIGLIIIIICMARYIVLTKQG